jgi:hypothetical protein
LSHDHYETYEVVDSIYGLSQSANIFGEGSDIGLVGSFVTKVGEFPHMIEDSDSITGVAHSADAGIY